MSDVITGMRQVIQDLVAPDMKANASKLDALQKQRSEFAALREQSGGSVSAGYADQ
jgi:hypothetical protein